MTNLLRHAKPGACAGQLEGGEISKPCKSVVRNRCGEIPARAKIAAEMSRLCSSRFERPARKLGWTRIAGLDEAGRGALFGPVVAAADILNPKRRIVGLHDPNQLAPGRRAPLPARIREHALAW